MSESTRMLLGLAIGIIVMIYLVSKTKIHTFIALIVACVVTGIIGGMPLADVVKTLDDGTKQTTVGLMTAIKNGFGNTLKSTGIIIGLGVMMGGILEKSGAAERMAYSFIKAVGKKKEEWALAITGWFISIPVFADSAVVIFAPLCKAISKVTGKSIVGLGLAMAAGLQLTHCLVPPTPGPTTAASMLHVDVGQMIILGALISIPMLIVAVLYCKFIGKKIYQVPNDEGGYDRKEFKQEYIKSMEELDNMIAQKELPGLFISIAPIVVPLILILVNTVLGLIGFDNQILEFIGDPVVALAVGTIIAIYGLMGHADKKKTLNIMDDAIKSTGIIMLITGAGGSLGNVIKVSGIGDALGNLVLAWPIPVILIPFIIAALMRIALGSATVAITTAASLSAPLVGVIAVSPLLMSLSCCVGAISFSYFNDSGFWVWNGMFGVDDIKDQVRCKTAVSLIMAAAGVIELLILGIFMK
ncbi:GntP family permease [Lachnospira pectinoschiza]|uniref:Gluconate:H+ symporter, GntP family n=1 Tax=Lachnospira pectinoschiza TaxID=28052 RepID=A0A1G9T292_9FIRM|nr:SLC13 family permease [Lachnospira pectinoschiza]SDM41748.1 gluconate:H+ symporter, GntP family [Lachnospira pectinoschiza]